MKVVVAPDKFAGTMTAAQAAAAIARGWSRVRPGDDVRLVPIADGGEGMIAAVAAAALCDQYEVVVSGPLGKPVHARWLRLRGNRAVVEAAEACGLVHVPPGQRDPLAASTAGVGQLLLSAADAGCRQILLGVGGSATVDGGAGMAVALGADLWDAAGAAVAPVPASMLEVHDVSPITVRLPPIIAAVDVNNPLLGPSGAAAVFAPQKGADAVAVQRLEAALERLANAVERNLPGGPWRQVPGAGAGGGLGFGLAAFADATIASGAEAVAQLIGLDAAIAGADIVVTGEGSLDEQTLRGKAPEHVRRLARAAGVPVLAVAGRAAEEAVRHFDAVMQLGSEGLRHPEALTEHAAACLARHRAVER